MSNHNTTAVALFGNRAVPVDVAASTAAGHVLQSCTGYAEQSTRIGFRVRSRAVCAWCAADNGTHQLLQQPWYARLCTSCAYIVSGPN